MEDLNQLFDLTESYPKKLEEISEDFLLKLRVILWGQAAITENKEKMKDLAIKSPHQSIKRAKRLSLLNEDNEVEDKLEKFTGGEKNIKRSPNKQSKRSNAELLAAAEAILDLDVPTENPAVTLRKEEAGPAVTNTDNEANTLLEIVENSEVSSLMPPPPAPCDEETFSKRPQRAAKLKSEKNLKEPQLKGKLRRPTNDVKIKLEHEQRSSQMHSVLTELNVNATPKSSLSSEKSNDSVFVIPGKEPSIVSISSDRDDGMSPTNVDPNESQFKKAQNNSETREVCIKVKREKVSLENQENLQPKPSDGAAFKLPAPIPLEKAKIAEETPSLATSILSATSNTTASGPQKKNRKKKEVIHKPIKVERFSDLDPKPAAPISSRTRNGSVNKSDNVDNILTKETKRTASIYEEAVQTPPSPNSNTRENMSTEVTDRVVNETVTLGPAADPTMNLASAPNDATFCTNQAQTIFQVAPGQTTFVMDSNPNVTITLNKQSEPSADATFDVHQITKTDINKKDDTGGQRSFETAKDSSIPNDNSLLTDDDDQEKLTAAKLKKVSNTNNNKKTKAMTKASASAKAPYKMTSRTNELFNPLAQSPVKLRVEAFENAAAAATDQSKRPLRNKREITMTSSSTTPVIGKLQAPALGRFLTPTQSSTLSSHNSAVAKKATISASKVLPMPKSACSTSLQRSNSAASAKLLQRENSADDFRKGLHNLAEERKKQREQKHLLAAQQREAKERERAERMAKLAKEREEKRKLKKQQEQEQKKRELEEIQRKLRQQKEEEEENAKLKAAKERELLHIKQQQQLAKHKMLPPPPKIASKYTFEMLHEDDSTDDEDKVSYKRPPPPAWSRSHVRASAMLKQEYTPSAVIDSFFSVQPMTPDLKIIFPNIDARHLKRNSSVLWSTPPRYSELPKY